MSKVSISTKSLRDRLIRLGHTVDDRGPLNTNVVPPPEMIITVAETLDDCQAPASGERYFVTLVDRVEYKPLIRTHPDFVLREPFAAAQEYEPVGGREMRGNFLLGPFRWLLSRLTRFPKILLWPEQRIRGSTEFVRAELETLEMPRLQEWLLAAGRQHTSPGAVVFDMSAVADCRVLWEVAEIVEASFFNYFIADVELREVYELDHHSKLVISVPDSNERTGLLQKLARYPEVIEDCSASFPAGDVRAASSRGGS
jgi:hypothetical protein